MNERFSGGNREQISVEYTAHFVRDVQELLKRFPPRHKVVYGHHSTIEYKPASLAGIEIGKELRLKIIGRAFDEKGDVLLVENPKSTKKHPHITLSCAEGVSQEYSNELLGKAISSGVIEYFAEPTEVSVVEGYFDDEKSKEVVSKS